MPFANAFVGLVSGVVLIARLKLVSRFTRHTSDVYTTLPPDRRRHPNFIYMFAVDVP